MESKEKIVQYWLTFVLTFIGFFKVLVFIPFVFQFSINNKYLVGLIDLIFKPADYASGLFMYLAAFSGPLIFLFVIVAGLAKFVLFAFEAYILAAAIRFLAKNESVKSHAGNAFNVLYEKLEIGKQVEKYPILRNTKYFIPLAAIIILAIAICSAPKKSNNKSADIAANKETIIEQAQKIDGSLDSDGDGLKDRAEFVLGTNPYFADTDNDEHSDYDELRNGFSPFIASPEGGGISAENFEPIHRRIFSGEDIRLEDLEKLRSEFIGQISSKLCEKSQSAGEIISEDSKKAAENAIRAKDTCACSKVQDDYYRNACLNKLANITINLNLCNYIFEEASAQDRREDCLSTSMLITKDGKYCDRMRVAKNQGSCFMVLSLKTKNYDLCERVKDREEKDSCYHATAIFTKRKDLCDRISLDNKSGTDREACKSLIDSGLIPKINF